MNKARIIDAIREHNRSVPAEFLSMFNERSLTSYLLRLTHLKDHRGRSTWWVREGDTPAIVSSGE